MSRKRDTLKIFKRLVAPYRVADGDRFRLRRIDPDDTGDFDSDMKPEAEALLQLGVEILAEAQDRLYAQDRRSLLVIFQAMDGAGKDSAIKHVMSGVNPQGCHVSAFKRPSDEELDHDYMWRCITRLPERGRIGIFNRSYYEEVLVVRVHREILNSQRLPGELVHKRIFEERLADMAAFERYLARNGTTVIKFFLHVSRGEQKRRFLRRLELPEKHWKFSPEDVREREHWDAYMDAYQHAVRGTASEEAPWYVVPADHKWFTHLVVAAAIVRTLEGMKLAYPEVDAARQGQLRAARRLLMRRR